MKKQQIKISKIDEKTLKPKYSTSLQLLFVILLTFLVYSSSFNNEWIMNWDDAGYVVENETIHSLSFNSVKEMFTSFYMSNYHPFTTLSYAVEYALVNDNVVLYHVDNLLLHLLNIILVFFFVKLLYHKKNSFVPFVVSLFFAIHPMHVESVAWISERKDVLYTFFFMFGLIFYLKYLHTDARKWKYYILSMLFFIFSLMSKSAAVIFPIVLLAIDWYEKRKISWKLVLEKIPLLALSMLFGLIAMKSQESAMHDLTPMLSFFERLLIVNFSVLTYLWKLFLPINLSAIYPYPLKVDGILPYVYFILPVVSLVIAFFLWKFRKNKELLFGVAFFLITIVLVLQFVPVGGSIVSERYSYVPYVGLLFPVAAFFESILANKKKLAVLFIAIPTIFFSLQSFDRISYWKNGDVLFSDVINKYPKLPFAYVNRGFLYWDYYALKVCANNTTKKEFYVNKAYADYSKSISLDNSYAEAWCNRAILLYNTGKFEQALSDFNMVLKIKHDYKDAVIGRANTLSTLKMYKEALLDYDTYLASYSNESQAWLWRGIAYCNLQNYDRSLSDIDMSLSLNSENYEAWYWKGTCCYYKKDFLHSLNYFDKCISLKPDYIQVYSWKGLVLYELKDFKSSVDAFSKAISLSPTDYSLYVNRAVSYYNLNDFDEALKNLDTAGRAAYPLNRDFYFAVVAKDKKFQIK